VTSNALVTLLAIQLLWYFIVFIQTNSMALVCKRTIPTERLMHASEVSANFCGLRGVTWSVQQIPTAVNLAFLDLELLLYIQIAPQLSPRGWVDPIPDPLLQTRNLWICSQELWPLDHRGSRSVCIRYVQILINQVAMYECGILYIWHSYTSKYNYYWLLVCITV
jgi:hypothetical protein